MDNNSMVKNILSSMWENDQRDTHGTSKHSDYFM